MKRMYEGILWLVGLIGIVVLLVLSWQYVLALRNRVFALQRQQFALPEAQLQEVGLAAELKKRAFDIERIRSLTVSRDELGRIISALEDEAQAKQIELTVPDVAERPPLDEAGNPTSATGPLLEIEMKVVGFGRAEDLLQWVHAAEYLPFLLHVQSMQLDTDSKTVPTTGDRRADNLKTSRLDVTLIVAVRHSVEEQ